MRRSLPTLALCLLPVLTVSGCTPPSAAARARLAVAPPAGPPGILASAPPADSSFYKLRCKPDGPDTICKRDTQ